MLNRQLSTDADYKDQMADLHNVIKETMQSLAYKKAHIARLTTENAKLKTKNQALKRQTAAFRRNTSELKQKLVALEHDFREFTKVRLQFFVLRIHKNFSYCVFSFRCMKKP